METCRKDAKLYLDSQKHHFAAHRGCLGGIITHAEQLENFRESNSDEHPSSDEHAHRGPYTVPDVGRS